MRKLLVLVAVAACAGAVHIGAAQAAPPPCGTIFSSTTLTSDCTAPLTIGASNITVNLGFHEILCESAVSGIVIPAWVRLSIVQNGFVFSDTAACATGVEVDGSSNQVSNIEQFEASGSGFQVAAGASFNRLIGDEALFNGDAGFLVFGSNNTVRLSYAIENTDDGISTFTATGNKISSNVSELNGDKGIISGSNQTTIASNQVVDNTFGIYLSDNSTGSTVYQNDVEDNGTGIDVATSTGNALYSNTSVNNTLDMNDANAFCDADIWKFNTFGTSNQGCIH